MQEHFLGTAQAVDQLTRSYRNVFDGLEHDANRLLGERNFQDALEARARLERRAPELPTIDERLGSDTPQQRRTPQLG